MKTIIFLFFQLTIYLFCLIASIADYSIVANITVGLCTGLVIGQFFLIGHDACHQALTDSAFLNKLIGRFAFSFSLHSYSLWKLEHNLKHHGYTNIKGIDPSWAPMTKEEFDGHSSFRQYLEKIYRSPLGSGLYYINEMWLKSHIFPFDPQLRGSRSKYIWDSLLLGVSFLAQLFIVIYLGHWLAPSKPLFLSIFLGWLLPFLSWNWMMGSVIYLHHTHPDIPWFKERKKRAFRQHQIHVTIHVLFSDVVNKLIYNIMEHTAHHLQPSISMDKLPLIQTQLESIHEEKIVSYRFTFPEYFKITKSCKLYDFEAQRWTDFSGSPTSNPYREAFSCDSN